ncbi:bifunctional glycosyltransferase family 2/GtrA family protein [Schaalia vaccimaxillae]|uniref:bifunctional glycosyltransferase family 2/GtrA family protein n=1 Tax=Schaalia vaccimaxillae TaxID=183916 RepID=UPI0003B5E05B|nr:bifunctional glycosyltransferase family 2/GtrA family protein [Schaalia vaccimaxillae]
MIVLIPAYQPDIRLSQLVLELHRVDPQMRTVVVDDGSGPDYSLFFDATSAAGADVVSYEANRGKGFALRTGLSHIRETYPRQAVVTADADGQHTVADIVRVGQRVESTGQVVLGVREFVGDVPLRSRIGNRATAMFFRLSTGWKLSDTQTGLRGLPAEQLEWMCSVKGDRYEYELSVLIEMRQRRLDVIELPIETIYEACNPTSHFRPLQDSARIYAPLLGFVTSSLTSSIVDYILVLLLNALMGSLLAPVVIARVISCTVNYLVNRRVLSSNKARVGRSAVAYGVLAVAILAASYGLIKVATAAGVVLWLAKPIVDSALFVVSYVVQKRFVFAKKLDGGNNSSSTTRSVQPAYLPTVPRLQHLLG